MKRLLLCAVLILALAIAVPAFAGNGLPVNGPHYNLNIIGVPKGKTAEMDGNHGHRLPAADKVQPVP